MINLTMLSRRGRLSQFLNCLPNSESPSLKFEWNRLLLGPDPWVVSIDSSLSSAREVRSYSLNPNPYNFVEYSLNPKFSLNLGMKLCDRNCREPICDVNGFEMKEDNPVSLEKNIDVASENSPNLGLSESKQEDYISLEEYADMNDDVEFPCEQYFSRNDEVLGDIHKVNLSSEEDSELLLPSKHEHEQCSDEFRHSNERYATLLKPKGDIQKKVFKIINLSKVISTDTNHLTSSGPKTVDARITRRDSENLEESAQWVNDDVEFPCEKYLSRSDEVLGDIHKVNLSSEGDSELLLPSNHEHKQCSDESRHSNERCTTLLKPKRDIQKKAFKIINLRKVISTDTNYLTTSRGPKTVNARMNRRRDSENLEESAQLVNSAFLQYFKQLNENSAQRKSFTENSGCMKCNVCGSDSKVFKDCKSLIAHAFGCVIPELRTKHLGFHKALCALMGWKSGTRFDKSWRYQKRLSDDEGLALKEDLIIWPPVVIIHNSSIQSKNPDDRIVVSNEELWTMLKEMGYAGSVCRGRPANQSIMVVKFDGTLCGLQEAERLHKYYCVTNHGRSDLQGVEVTAVNRKMESVLFGYLGLAEDLEKLDYETKKRCVVKSKKEIQEIADATLARPKSEI